jgi:hypothetical protein
MKRHVRKKFERVEIEKLLLKGKFKKNIHGKTKAPFGATKPA